MQYKSQLFPFATCELEFKNLADRLPGECQARLPGDLPVTVKKTMRHLSSSFPSPLVNLRFLYFRNGCITGYITKQIANIISWPSRDSKTFEYHQHDSQAFVGLIHILM
jgi:hypothetical protein